MPKIDRLTVERVLETARIEEVVGDYIDLRRRGVRYTGICPFHDDRHMGNFSVYPPTNVYKCFACEASGGPVDFLMRHARMTFPEAIHWLGQKYNIDTNMTEPMTHTPPPPRPKPKPKELLCLPFYLVENRQKRIDNDALCNWIRHGINWDSARKGEIMYVLTVYHVGHTTIEQRLKDNRIIRHEFTVFWEIDERQQVRTAHLMKYKPDGHRMKNEDDSYNQDWYHSLLTRRRKESDPYPYPQYYDPDKQQHQATYFGMHLLERYGREATVCIVESEKTALLMAIAYGNSQQRVWMACCGLTNLTRERLQPIIERRRRIVLYPDRDGIDRWKQQAERIGYDLLTVDTTPVTEWWTEADGPKADIADIVVRHINATEQPRTTEQVVQQVPQAKELIDKLDLELMKDNNDD